MRISVFRTHSIMFSLYCFLMCKITIPPKTRADTNAPYRNGSIAGKGTGSEEKCCNRSGSAIHLIMARNTTSPQIPDMVSVFMSEMSGTLVLQGPVDLAVKHIGSQVREVGIAEAFSGDEYHIRLTCLKNIFRLCRSRNHTHRSCADV